MLGTKFQSHGIKIEDFKIIPINPLNPISTKRRVSEVFDLILLMSYIMPKMLSSAFKSHSIKIEDFKSNPFISFNPISTKGVG